MNLAATTTVTFRHPELEDGKEVWELIREIDVLDLNSSYYYLILCEYFGNTCMVAEVDKEIVGFVSGFRHPEDQQTLFVWQVAVAASQRGEGLAFSLIDKLLESEECEDVTTIQTTISPSNKASHALFEKVARHVGANMEKTVRFLPRMFPGTDHETEQTYEIKPITRKNENRFSI
ncbi:diaminobutyrate acetyltransferase [Salsuginibacillus kocurii]|uniref:diaminobutyrate acetyltransferase n=1 Tax=Salsuginibacillus kocurii TaxID=427078 RepID=UPI000375DC7E|nr:diaminobutyrate acetyltransferase [Salsuginibacillus kocurii]